MNGSNWNIMSFFLMWLAILYLSFRVGSLSVKVEKLTNNQNRIVNAQLKSGENVGHIIELVDQLGNCVWMLASDSVIIDSIPSDLD